MYKSRPFLFLMSCIVLTVSVILLKIFYPELIYFNSGLMLAILLTIFLPREGSTYLFAAITVLIILFTYLLTNAENKAQALPNQALAVFVAILTTGLVIYIKRLNRAVDAERTHQMALFEHAAEGIILTDEKGQIVMLNPAAQKQFQYKSDELLGKTIFILMPEREHHAFSDLLEQYDNIPLYKSFRNSADSFGLKKNAEEFPIEISRSHYTRLSEKFVLIFITDISSRREFENNLLQQKNMLEKVTHDMRKMNIELENKVLERTLILQEALQELEKSQLELSETLNKEKELNEIKSRFVSMASHEFRTPLSTILSSASLISRYLGAEDQDKRDKHTCRIKSSVKHLNELLEDFLNIGKLEEGRVFIEKQLFDVKEFLQDTLDEMSAMLKPGQEIDIDFTGEVMFQTDKRLLKNVMINLLSNAIKFSEAGKSIQVLGVNNGSQLKLQVRDHGIGIPPEDLPHLFSTFYRGKNVVNIQGTGLGLNIVQRYINLLSGTIDLTSQLHEGTTFNMSFPAFK